MNHPAKPPQDRANDPQATGVGTEDPNERCLCEKIDFLLPTLCDTDTWSRPVAMVRANMALVSVVTRGPVNATGTRLAVLAAGGLMFDDKTDSLRRQTRSHRPSKISDPNTSTPALGIFFFFPKRRMQDF